MECKRYPAMRALFGVAVACGLGAPAAMQVSAFDSSEPQFFTQEHWPTVRWVEPPAFVIAGLPSDADTSIDKVVPLHVDAGDRSGLLLMLLQRLAWEAEAIREPSMFDLEIDITGWLTRQRVPVQRDEPAGGLDAVGAAPDAAPATTGATTLVTVPTFRKASGSKTTRQRLSTRRVKAGTPAAFAAELPPQLSAAWDDLLPVRSLPLLPLIGFALAMLAVGWISWRAAAPAAGPSPPPAGSDAVPAPPKADSATPPPAPT